MNLNSLLLEQGISPEHVIAMRHRPFEADLNKVLPWLAADRPVLYNAYQQTQGLAAEGAMHRLEGTGYVASFIRHRPKQALFVGLYAIHASRWISHRRYWQMPAHRRLRALGMVGFQRDSKRTRIRWFDLKPQKFCSDWKGKLVVSWPTPERSWWRRAHRNALNVLAILEESTLAQKMPAWDHLTLTWEELQVLPKSWQDALRQWRGVYHIVDLSDNKRYVGATYGKDRLLGRWLHYAKTGHAGNKLLRGRDPANFVFSILQTLPLEASAEAVAAVEATWKVRLATRAPHGLNDN